MANQFAMKETDPSKLELKIQEKECSFAKKFHLGEGWFVET